MSSKVETASEEFITRKGRINMNQMMAYCGIMCDECPAYKATVDDSDELRKNTAKLWSKLYNADIRPEQVNCLGCRSGVRYTHCGVCEIRACNLENQLDNCGVCDSFPCSKASTVVDHVPGAKERLKASEKESKKAPPKKK